MVALPVITALRRHRQYDQELAVGLSQRKNLKLTWAT